MSRNTEKTDGTWTVLDGNERSNLLADSQWGMGMNLGGEQFPSFKGIQNEAHD